jgi:diguanylate cyclase (GGDEF)-like protein
MGLQQTRSLDQRVLVFIVLFALMLCGLAGVACIGFQVLYGKVETVNERWLASTQTLGELDFRIAAFRIGETYRATARDDDARAKADSYAAGQRQRIQNLFKGYQGTFSEPGLPAEPAALGTALQAYFAAHDKWISGVLDDSATFEGPLHRLFEAADDAVDRAVEANETAVQMEVETAKSIVVYAVAAVLCVAAAMLTITSWILVRSRRNVSRPLASITRALSKLAAGNRDITVPETDRTDEIGTLANAFERFRENVVALEKAHEATRAAQNEAHALERHDPLTGLSNRRVFFFELQAALDQCRRRSRAYSVLLIGLDKFKSINDLYGHQIGDLVLCETAQRLRHLVRKTDTVARLGGDEFAIVSESDPQDPLEAGTSLANRVLAAIREPISIRQYFFEMDASIGVASAPAGDTDAEGLLRAADIAMFRAKSDGRGTFRFFEEAMDQELRLRTEFEADLRDAVADGLVQPYYQPIIDIRDDRIWGFEILARWHHPEHGWVPPDRFIPVADCLGLLPRLTSSLLQRACRDASEWAETIHLALNIAPSQFRNPLLPSDLLTILNRESFAPSRLEVEMTESALVEDVVTAKAIISELRRAGVKISLDDFGTGYSSLNHLREFKFDRVKIDRSFVTSLDHNAESTKIVEAIISLAKSLGLAAVAEGIEDRSVLQHLVDRGCEFGQGYLFGKPMAAADASTLLAGELLIAE